MGAALTCDTSVVVAALSAWHVDNATARDALKRVDWLGAHVLAETVSVLSRLPHGHAVTLQEAAALVRQVAAAQPTTPRQLRADRYLLTFGALGSAGLGGGAVYDAIVGATAREHDATLLSLDRRAQRTYVAVGAAFEALG